MTEFAPEIVPVNIGDELYFENKLAFCNDILKLDITVPPRRKERQHFHKERYCIVLYLKKLVSAQLVSFPFGIKKNEFPDFVLFKPDNTSIGIEVSEITKESYQQSLSQIPDNNKFEPIFLSKFSNSKNEDPSFINSGWVGDTVEHEWANLSAKIIIKKTLLLNKHYQNSFPIKDSLDLSLSFFHRYMLFFPYKNHFELFSLQNQHKHKSFP